MALADYLNPFPMLKSIGGTLGGYLRGVTADASVAGNQVEPLSVPRPLPRPPGGNQAYLARLQDFYKSQMPPSSTTAPSDYYPAYDQLPKLVGAEQLSNKPGLAALLALQLFMESTGGRGGNGNYFGAIPGGEGNAPASFPDFLTALKYHLSNKVLGGGGNPNMNILSDNNPLTSDRISQLYQSYNPGGSQLPFILNYFPQLSGY